MTRIALVTGASRGIGFEIAKAYAKAGMHVIAVARTERGLNELADAVGGNNITLVQLDLREFEKYDQLAQMIQERFGRLDVLVGNAAILGEITPMQQTDPGEWHKTIDINLNANFHLLRVFDPLLRASDAPRAIFVTSGVTTHISPYWGAYAVTKAALETMVQTYAAENTKTPIKVNLFDPGRTRTRMRAQAFPGEDPDTLPPPEHVCELMLTLASPACKESGKRYNAATRKAG